jgi:hypothetical protein
MPIDAYYDSSVDDFLRDDSTQILGTLAAHHHHALEELQRWAWLEQIEILRRCFLEWRDGHIFFEVRIPRIGKRVDCVLIMRGMVFVLEFKTGSATDSSGASVQVYDYALDLKNFHEGSHCLPIIPVVILPAIPGGTATPVVFAPDGVAAPIIVNEQGLVSVVQSVCTASEFPEIDVEKWVSAGYKPTPTIIEAASVLYATHQVRDISRCDADATNLTDTTECVVAIAEQCRRLSKKAIVFITGVPGSGKTLAGLNLATRLAANDADEYAVFLSGNGPLVHVLREALARDSAKREGISKTTAGRRVRSFIQNVHHFRDHYLKSTDAPLEQVVIFDEAQRAWSQHQTSLFMQRKRGHVGFNMSEPEFLISVMNRRKDWCTIICLIGEGQEINTGEAGITEWFTALNRNFSDWEIHFSPRLVDQNAALRGELSVSSIQSRTKLDARLHLASSIRSFRAESLSHVIDRTIGGDPSAAQEAYHKIRSVYPIKITRDLNAAKRWLREQARGSERTGLIASSGAMRLRPEGVFIEVDPDPAKWFLNEPGDVRSSSYLEEAATEFTVQGLELDWAGVCWDGDYHRSGNNWQYQAFRGTRWQQVVNPARQNYLRNAYRVILTRARQGMVLFVPAGSSSDPTRMPCLYDDTVAYLQQCGFETLEN